jgi:outer membrane protein TolC
MQTNYVPSVLRITALLFLIWGASAFTQAQTPAATPPVNPSQQDATRPPGTQTNQPIPEQARPVTQDPTAPPGVQRTAPSSPPGTNVTPQTVTPGVTQPAQTQPSTQTDTTSGSTTQTDLTAEPREPNLPNSQPQPVPPLPDLTRLGINSDRSLTLTLNEAIRRALENNNDIEIARDDVRIQETTLRSLQGIYEPVFNLTPQINNLVQSQQSVLSGSTASGTVTQTDMTVNSNITKLFQPGGGNYQFFFNNNRRTTNSTFNTLNPVFSGSLGATFTQPLWRDRSIDNNRRQIRIQRKRLQQSDADFRRQTILVISQVQNAYWDLVFALRDQQNKIANVNLARENLRQIEARIAAGAVAPLGRAEIQTELSNRESDLLISSQNVSIAENNLKQLILRDPLSPDWSAPVTPTDEPSFDSTPVNLTDALTEARANRPELQRLHLQRDINDIDLQYFKNQTRPRIDIQSTLATTGLSGTPVVATGSLTGGTTTTTGNTTGQVPLIIGDPNTVANAFLLSQINILRAAQGLGAATVPLITPQTSSVPTDLIGGYGRTLRNLFRFDTRNVVVGVAFQIPFHNKTAEANLAGARIQRNQLEATTRVQEQSVEVEVRNAAQAVETARRRVLAARSARQNAELQLTGEQRLYQAGRSTTFLLLQRENELANARNLEIRAETDYNKALAELQRATSTTLHANNIIVETP